GHILVCVIISELRIPFFIFFSSRRRHTRSKRDWSSDVCSSDLWIPWGVFEQRAGLRLTALRIGTLLEHSPRDPTVRAADPLTEKIGRASCRGRVDMARVNATLKNMRLHTVWMYRHTAMLSRPSG